MKQLNQLGLLIGAASNKTEGSASAGSPFVRALHDVEFQVFLSVKESLSSSAESSSKVAIVRCASLKNISTPLRTLQTLEFQNRCVFSF